MNGPQNPAPNSSDRTKQIRRRMLKMQLMDVINALEDTVYEAQLELQEHMASKTVHRAADFRIGGRFAIVEYNSGIQPMVTFIVERVVNELGDNVNDQIRGSAIYATHPGFSEFVGENVQKLGDVVNALYTIRAALD